MKKSLLIIGALIVSFYCMATCYFNWTCKKCGKFEQTTSYSCKYDNKPTDIYDKCEAPNQKTYDGSYAGQHNWIMTGYFER